MLEIYFEVLGELVREGKAPSRIRVNLSDAAPAKPIAQKGTAPKRPKKSELYAAVQKAQNTITFNGGTPTRAATKRTPIDDLSYSYGLLWGIASALDCSLKEVVARYGTPDAKR